MNKHTPLYDSYDPDNSDSNEKSYGIGVVGSLNGLMQVIAIRSSVFMSEQECPYEEEFDGNDFCATHLVGYLGREPVACLRARFFADFAKLERLAVRHQYRDSRISFMIIRAGIELARKKGYRSIYGHAQDRLVNFWSRFGAQPMIDRPIINFSDFSYTEMLLQSAPHPDPITLESDPYEIIRPEGQWHKPGILDQSANRPVSSPLKNNKAA